MTIWNTICKEKQRDVNVFDLTAIGVGSSLAVGGFVVFGDLIKNVAGPAVLISIALAFTAALLAGICFTELAVQFLKADSSYTFSYSFSNKHIAFVYGWALILEYATGAASVAKGVICFIDALTENKISNFLKDVTPTYFESVFVYFDFLSLAIIVIVIILLGFGIKDSTAVKNIFTLYNIVLIVCVIIVGSLKVNIENWHNSGSENGKSEGGFTPYGILGVTKGAAIAFYGFIGFDNIGVSGSDVKNRKRSLPIAVVTTIVIVFLAHIGIGVVLTLTLPYYKLSEHAAMPFAFDQLGYTTAKWFIIVSTFLGLELSLLGASFPLPRVIQAMASDRLLFSFLDDNPLSKNISKSAILCGGLLSAAAAGILSFNVLVSLTVLGATMVYTIIAINVLLARYCRKRESDRSQSWTVFVNENLETSTETKNCFGFNQTAIYTEKIIVGVIILYCLGSVGLSVTYSIFFESLFKGSYEAVAPACVCLCIILISLFWLLRQPKLKITPAFQVPFVPILPCLSIFLNIFLMATFDSNTWILFSGWIIIGISLHLVCQCLNCYKGNLGKDSLYEINKSNTLKLNEAIWKINSEKKSFYEGAVNPVFIDETEITPGEVKREPESEIKIHNEKAILQLKQAEIIQTAEMIMEEKTEPLEFDEGTEFVGLEGNSPEGNNNVHWECVAEIHTEEEFPQESVVLEIVDNTYNFLSEVSEESPGDNVSRKSADKSIGSIEFEKKSNLNELKTSDEEATQPLTEATKDLKMLDGTLVPYRSLQAELFEKIKCRRKNEKEKTEEKCIISEPLHNSEDSQIEDEFVNFVIETLYQAPKGVMLTRINGEIVSDADTEKETKILEEHNRIKDFKEKLNQLLKNQINSGGNPEKNFTDLKNNANDVEVKRKKSEETLFESIKTLNKTQIRGKLEVLLAKGPPKRPSFKNQFTNKVNKEKLTEEEKSEQKDSEVNKPSNDDIKSDSAEIETTENNVIPISHTETEIQNSACSV